MQKKFLKYKKKTNNIFIKISIKHRTPADIWTYFFFLYSLIGISIGAKLDYHKLPLIMAGLNPLPYGVDGLRSTLIGRTDFGIVTDLSILLILTVILLVISSYFFEKLET